MRLADLNPKLDRTIEDGILRFDCPHPGCKHQVRVHISSQPFHERQSRPEDQSPGNSHVVKVWQAAGSFPETLTLSPSIDVIEADEDGNKIRTLCWHGFVTNGNVT